MTRVAVALFSIIGLVAVAGCGFLPDQAPDQVLGYRTSVSPEVAAVDTYVSPGSTNEVSAVVVEPVTSVTVTPEWDSEVAMTEARRGLWSAEVVVPNSTGVNAYKVVSDGDATGELESSSYRFVVVDDVEQVSARAGTLTTDELLTQNFTSDKTAPTEERSFGAIAPGGLGESEFETPQGVPTVPASVAVDFGNELVYVLDTALSNVQAFDLSGAFQNRIDLPTERATGMTVDQATGDLYVIDEPDQEVYRAGVGERDVSGFSSLDTGPFIVGLAYRYEDGALLREGLNQAAWWKVVDDGEAVPSGGDAPSSWDLATQLDGNGLLIGLGNAPERVVRVGFDDTVLAAPQTVRDSTGAIWSHVVLGAPGNARENFVRLDPDSGEALIAEVEIEIYGLPSSLLAASKSGLVVMESTQNALTLRTYDFSKGSGG